MPIERFTRWYRNPITKLKELPNGDGGFAAFIIALPLYERYIVSKLKLEGKETNQDSIKTEISADLNLTDDQRKIFWEMFRNGFLHGAMPKDGRTQWLTSAEFTAYPEFKTIEDRNYVCIDPWKFADRILDEYYNNTDLITASESFPLASIFTLN
jgi:hypothetical protein